MPALIRRSWILIPLFFAGLIAGLATYAPAWPAIFQQSGAPSVWTLLANDNPGDCAAPADAGREGTAAHWAHEGKNLHLRLCTADLPGWDPSSSGAGGWTDARYKWWLITDTRQFLLMVEDAELPAMPGSTTLDSDGQGEITLINDIDGNGRFSDDWAASFPPAYLNNAAGSPVWRRAWSTSTGSGQSSSQGDVGDIGFQLGKAGCGAVIDVYVNAELLGNPDQVCVRWATDGEVPGTGLDSAPACDNMANKMCVTLADTVEPSTTPRPQATQTETAVPPTRTATRPPPVAQTATPTASDTPEPTDPPTATRTRIPPTASDTPEPTATRTRVPPTATDAPTDTPEPTDPPTATRTRVPPTATEKVEPTNTPTATRTIAPMPETATPTDRPPPVLATDTPTATDTAEPTATRTRVPPTATDTAEPPDPPTATRTIEPVPATATDKPEPTNTPTATWTIAPVPVTATATQTPRFPPVLATATPTVTTSPVRATATPGASPTIAPWPATPLATSTRVGTTPTPPPWPNTPQPSSTPGGGIPTPPGPPTPPGGGGGLGVCVLEVDPNGNNPQPFPEPVDVYAQLLTPYGSPAAPPVKAPTNPPSTSCVAFDNLEAGMYRTWPAGIPPGYVPYTGTAPTQTVWVTPNQPYSQVVFRYMPCYCPPGGGVPTPPGPPTPFETPTPPGIPTPPGPPTPPAPPAGLPTAYPPSPDRPYFGCNSQLPILNFLGNDPVCTTWVEVQNIGDRPAKALMLVWGPPGFCPPQCVGPLKVECSGLLVPGSAWNFLGGQMPSSAKSGAVISANADPHGNDIFADALCEALFNRVVGDCGEYRRFWKAYTEHGRWEEFDFGYLPCQPLAVEALRTCPGDVRPDVDVTASYTALSNEYLGVWDPLYGGFAFYAPSIYAGAGGYTSILYIQNAGLECTSLEIWFKAHDDCLRPRICDVLTLAPGESFQFDASSCLPAGWKGGAWVRSTQPLAIAVDHVGNDVLMTYTGMPAALNYTWDGTPLFSTGSPVGYGPLVYSEYQGWDSAVTVQNMSRSTAAKVKVYFLDRSGDVITTVVDWVCAQGSQTFYLPVIADLPGNWVGSVRVESQDWFSPGSDPVAAPAIHAIAELIQYTDVMRTEAQEALAYELFPEALAYDWQVGTGCGGLCSGVGRIGIPSFHKDQHGSGVTSEVAIVNLVPKPGFTDFAIFIYDQNGLLDFVCEKLHDRQVEYIDLDNWGFINPGFKGSAIISATFWEHEMFDGGGRFLRNLVGLAAVKVERSGTSLGNPIPGDESAGNPGIPLPGVFGFTGPSAPSCPGQPQSGGGFPTPGNPPGGTPPVPPGPPTPFAAGGGDE